MKMTSEDTNECPLCMDALDYDDTRFFPCTCGYQICRFCWTRIINEENGLCPACRKPYNSENPASFNPLTEEEITTMRKEKKVKSQQRKAKLSESRKHLGEFRVVQTNLLFVVGIPIKLASDIELLKGPEYFGKYGKVFKLVCNMNTQFTGTSGPSVSAYVTYCQTVDAIRAILGLRKKHIDGRTIKVSLGTTKYCSQFLKGLKCTKADCMYLHDLADDEVSFTKQDMKSGKHTEYENKLIENYRDDLGLDAITTEETNKKVSTTQPHQSDKPSRKLSGGSKSTCTSKKTSSRQAGTGTHVTTSNACTNTSTSKSACSSQPRKKTDSCSSTGSSHSIKCDNGSHIQSVSTTSQHSSSTVRHEVSQYSTVGSCSDTGLGSSICDSSQGSASSTSSSAGGHLPIELSESVRPPQTQSAPQHQECQVYDTSDKAFQHTSSFPPFGGNPNSTVSLSSSFLEEGLESQKNNLASSYHSGVSYSLNINNAQSNGHLPDMSGRLQTFKSSPSFHSNNYDHSSSHNEHSLENFNNPDNDDDDAKLDFDPILESQTALAQLLEAEKKPYLTFNQQYTSEYDNQIRKTLEQQFHHHQYIQQMQFNQRLQQQQYQQQLLSSKQFQGQVLPNLSATTSNSSNSQNKGVPAPPPGFEGVAPQNNSHPGDVLSRDMNSKVSDQHFQHQHSLLNSLLTASGGPSLPPEIVLSQLTNAAASNSANINSNGSTNPSMAAATLANCLSQQMQLYSMASYLQQQRSQQKSHLDSLSTDTLSQLMQNLSQNATNYTNRQQSPKQQLMPHQSVSNDLQRDPTFLNHLPNQNQQHLIESGDIHHTLKSLLPHANISYGNNGIQRSVQDSSNSLDMTLRNMNSKQPTVNYNKGNVEDNSWSFDDPAILVSGQLASSPNLREEFWNLNGLSYHQLNVSNQQGTQNAWNSGLSFGVSLYNNQSNMDPQQPQATQLCNQQRNSNF